MDANHGEKHFLNLGKKIGLCVRGQDKRVLFQNENCVKTCGLMMGEVCAKACNTLYTQVEECSAISEGMRLFKAVDVEGHKVDALIVNDGERITTLLYPLDEDQEKFKKQELYFQERGLTKSEIRIMQMVLQGMTNASIAEKLFISKATLKTHLNNIYKKLPASMRPSQVRG
ncbi:LuxR C-terminal-related transcriptional regulator [Bdellovibrio sp. 22V]|uniref:helix-turn-helix transcriptional regulator n=1 Tax=Bdellovibrio TaxID=958 RepID=UPI002543F686|nr:LuxR C-terminal-related transcriptional regulator [Bdellovibrio sp. 22V]WII71171.1 LuxR C-terminal-related transcriptional regulator [Bdellovibrio sp. 22V]